MVVDEAHHIHAQGELESIVNRFAKEKKSWFAKERKKWLLLLSDVSQSGSIEMMDNIFGAQEIRLTEVSTYQSKISS